MISILTAAVAFAMLPSYAAILPECDNVHFLDAAKHWLYAECPDDFGAVVQSTAFVPNWISNNEGRLVVCIFLPAFGTRFRCLYPCTDEHRAFSSGPPPGNAPLSSPAWHCSPSQHIINSTYVSLDSMGNYQASCRNCAFTASLLLQCECKPTWGQHVPASISLGK
jgi:hypothetical protein